jgi:succinate dehydrogenase / fumarate reductase cytochrome b subunit
VGKKFLMALTGLAMIGFLVEHLIGNFLLLSKNPVPYNEYGHFLISFGNLLIVAEFILIGILVAHMISAISISIGKKTARPEDYKVKKDAGRTSKKTFSSMTMIYTGVILFVFLVIHIKTFKFGPYYNTAVDGVEMRDLHKLVWETFQNPVYAVWYVFALVFLGFHLRHGFWSAFQSLGVSHPRLSPLISTVGVLTAAFLAVGFIGIPIWIYIMGA